MRIGVDVGGTNTDAVLVDGRDILAEAKTPTTADVTGGISAAVHALVDNGEVGADEEHRAEDRVQKLTDEHTKAIDELLKHKEAEIMEV